MKTFVSVRYKLIHAQIILDHRCQYNLSCGTMESLKREAKQIQLDLLKEDIENNKVTLEEEKGDHCC